MAVIIAKTRLYSLPVQPARCPYSKKGAEGLMCQIRYGEFCSDEAALERPKKCPLVEVKVMYGKDANK